MTTFSEVLTEMVQKSHQPIYALERYDNEYKTWKWFCGYWSEIPKMHHDWSELQARAVAYAQDGFDARIVRLVTQDPSNQTAPIRAEYKRFYDRKPKP